MSVDLLGMIAVFAFCVVLFGLLAVGAVFVIRDTIRQRGNWGINWNPAACTECGTAPPAVRMPANRRQALWGGWTCVECGLELDKWGRPIEGQDGPAKWKVLRAAEETEERPRRSRRRDERIRDRDDHTQRGDES